MAAIVLPEPLQDHVTRLVRLCHERVGAMRRGFDFAAFYRELREQAGESGGPSAADIAFLQFLREKVHEMRRER